MKKLIAILISLALVSVTFAADVNLIFNGDFEQGNTGFSTDYAYNGNHSPTPPNWVDLQEYTVYTSPSLVHQYWVNYGDKTSGTGNMLIVNGATAENQTVWQQTVSVTPNTDYVLSYWLSSCHDMNLANLDCSINGTTIGITLAPSTTGVWEEVFYSWNSESNSTATIKLVDLTYEFVGNDFAIDDISFLAIQEPEPPSPEEQIQEILNFISTCIPDTLVGTGNNPEKNEDKLKKTIEKARNNAASELFDEAWSQLFKAYRWTDGYSQPPDLVIGTSATELADRIMSAMEDLLPDYEMVDDYPNAMIFSFSGKIDERPAHVLAKITIGAAPQTLLWLGGGAIGPVSVIIGIVAEALHELAQTIDPVRVLPVAPNVEVQNGTYVAENVTDDTEYSAIIFLDFIGAGWEDWTLDDAHELKLESRHGHGGYTHDELFILSSDQMRDLETSKNYAVFPKVFFSVSDLPSNEDAVWLEASFKKGPPINTYEGGTGLHLSRN